MLKDGLQKSIQFKLNFFNGPNNEEKASLAEFLIDDQTKRERLKLIRAIEEECAAFSTPKVDMSYFFNFGLNTTTWRHLVNK